MTKLQRVGFAVCAACTEVGLSNVRQHCLPWYPHIQWLGVHFRPGVVLYCLHVVVVSQIGTNCWLTDWNICLFFSHCYTQIWPRHLFSGLITGNKCYNMTMLFFTCSQGQWPYPIKLGNMLAFFTAEDRYLFLGTRLWLKKNIIKHTCAFWQTKNTQHSLKVNILFWLLPRSKC